MDDGVAAYRDMLILFRYLLLCPRQRGMRLHCLKAPGQREEQVSICMN